MTEKEGLKVLEVVSALVILFCVPAVAIPKLADVKRRETAATVLEDVDVMRAAVFGFYSDSAYFPPDSAGEIPGNLVPYLPAAFSRTRPYGTLDYRNWPVQRPTGADSAVVSNVIGVTVNTKDPKVGATAANIAPAVPRFTVDGKPTFLFFGS